CAEATMAHTESRYLEHDASRPVTPLQEGMLFHARYDVQGPDVYTVQLLIGLDGPLHAGDLESALQALLQRHAVLRAGFQHENLSRPVQVIVSSAKPPWRSIDLSEQDAAAQEQQLTQILAADRAEHFD